ncbi:MAG: magnesium transporter CorA family protein [Alphaproteobacteria bacterium]|nr:magnesium transporter CorA family protein [Alphaproteobacteria bacterium]
MFSDSRGVRCQLKVDKESERPPGNIVWIDLLRPEPDEMGFVERITGLKVPSHDELSEIESSSRLRARGGALYLSAPLIYRPEPDQPISTPVGFVLTRNCLITVRFAELSSFGSVAEHRLPPDSSRMTSADVFIELLEAVVDRLADALERSASELDSLSHRLFRKGPSGPSTRRRSMDDADLRVTLRRVGHHGDLASKIRDSLLGIARIVPFVSTMAADWLPTEVKPRLDTLRQDVTSLNDYDAHLVNKVQLLLDATLGMINIDQNNIIKVLTIVSVVGVPPTLVASMYGMNFRNMPELEWVWGYPYGLTLIALSAVLPLVWFKWRGWF